MHDKKVSIHAPPSVMSALCYLWHFRDPHIRTYGNIPIAALEHLVHALRPEARPQCPDHRARRGDVRFLCRDSLHALLLRLLLPQLKYEETRQWQDLYQYAIFWAMRAFYMNL